MYGAREFTLCKTKRKLRRKGLSQLSYVLLIPCCLQGKKKENEAPDMPPAVAAAGCVHRGWVEPWTERGEGKANFFEKTHLFFCDFYAFIHLAPQLSFVFSY